MATGFYPQAAVVFAGIFEGDPEADNGGGFADQITGVLVPAYFAADVGLFEDVHGLPEYRVDVADFAQQPADSGLAAECLEFRYEVMQGMTWLAEVTLDRAWQQVMLDLDALHGAPT